jgi:asparagine synthase (glutamine-hydrolysing)
MCGVVGVLDSKATRDPDEFLQLVRDMSKPLRWRGPDGEGAWVDDHGRVAFGHRRLRVLDLSEAASQPMVSPSGRYVLTFNGEIYNFIELREKLHRRGLPLHSTGDTAVLCAAFDRWGVRGAIERIEGMFAFGVWDREERRLTLVRDRMGEKPLFYGLAGTEVVFASGLDSFRAHPRFNATIDRNSVALFLRHQCVPSPYSIYENVWKLPPGCLVEVSERGEIGAPEKYWDLKGLIERGSSRPFAGSPNEAVDELERLLTKSVANRMIADVPVGAFLSGGIDSSIIVSLMQSASSGPVRTFTMGSPTADFDESADARLVAAHLGTVHQEIHVDASEALALVPRLAEIYDEPFADVSQVPTYLLARLARTEVTVSLTGDGGDELFCGYNRYTWIPALWRIARLAPQPVRAQMAAWITAIAPHHWDRAASVVPRRTRPRMLGLKLAKVAELLPYDDADEMFHRVVSHWADPTSLVLGAVEPPTMHTDRSSWPQVPTVVERMMAIDALTYLPDDILVKLDRATMAVSLESRVPMLDRAVVEFAASLPISYKIRNGRDKWLLRQMLERTVPVALTDRPKSGFGVPIEDWLRGPLRRWAEDLLFGPSIREFLNTETIHSAWYEHQRGVRNHAYLLWDVLMLASWLELRG